MTVIMGASTALINFVKFKKEFYHQNHEDCGCREHHTFCWLTSSKKKLYKRGFCICIKSPKRCPYQAKSFYIFFFFFTDEQVIHVIHVHCKYALTCHFSQRCRTPASMKNGKQTSNRPAPCQPFLLYFLFSSWKSSHFFFFYSFVNTRATRSCMQIQPFVPRE